MHKPYARGVSHLMYIGDTAPTAQNPPPGMVAAGGAEDYLPIGVAGLVAWKSKGIVRWAALGIGGYLAFRKFARSA